MALPPYPGTSPYQFGVPPAPLPAGLPPAGHPAQLPAAPLPPPLPYPGYQSPQDLLAAATKAITDAYAPQLAEMRRQQEQERLRNLAQQAGLTELYKILSGSFGGGGGQVSDIYNQAAGNIGKYTQGSTSGDLPLEQQIVGSGAAYSGYGSAFPQLAGQQGQVAFLKAVQEGNASEADTAAQIATVLAGEPAKIQDLVGQLQRDQTDLQKNQQTSALALYNAGVITQRDLARAFGSPNWKQYPATSKPASGSSGSTFTTRTVGGSLYAIDKTTGQPTLLIKAPANASKPTTKTVGGVLYQWDPATKQWGSTGIGTPTSVTKQPTNTGPYFIDPTTHQPRLKPGYQELPDGSIVKTSGGGKVIVGPTGVPLTKGQIKSYTQDTVTTIRAALGDKATIPQIVAALAKSPIPRGVWAPVLAKRFGIPSWVVRGVTSEGQMSQLRFMTVNRLHAIAGFLGYTPDPASPLNKAQLVSWIQEHVPKARAAAEPAAYKVGSSVVQTALQEVGKPYVWGAESPSQGFDCSGLLYWAFGQHGISLPRTSQEMFKVGVSVPKNQLRPGDAVFWKGYTNGVGGPGHVGMYIGNGQVLVAPGSGETVRVEDLTRHSGYMGARRFSSLGQAI